MHWIPVQLVWGSKRCLCKLRARKINIDIKKLIKKATKGVGGGGGGGYFARITVWMLSNIQTTHVHTHAHISFAVYHAATIQIGPCKKASMWWVSSTVWIIHISLLLTVYLKLASNDKVVVSDEVRLQPNAGVSFHQSGDASTHKGIN